MTVDELKGWVETAAPGDAVEYHRGPYVVGRPVGAAAYVEYLDGRIILTQRKIKSGLFSYLATRTSPKGARVLAALRA